jgi:hypothetical protein
MSDYMYTLRFVYNAAARTAQEIFFVAYADRCLATAAV